jgi:hypothetical protein
MRGGVGRRLSVSIASASSGRFRDIAVRIRVPSFGESWGAQKPSWSRVSTACSVERAVAASGPSSCVRS